MIFCCSSPVLIEKLVSADVAIYLVFIHTLAVQLHLSSHARLYIN